jgi:hypothetical protein
MHFVPLSPCVAGGEEIARPVAIVKIAKVRNSRQSIVVTIARIITEIESLLDSFQLARISCTIPLAPAIEIETIGRPFLDA